MMHINGMELLWTYMSDSYDGPFHHLLEQHLHRYINELAGRHNIRNNDTVDMANLIAEHVGLRLTYETGNVNECR